MSDSIEHPTTVKDPASDRKHGGIGEVGVLAEQACLLSSELGTELLEVARKQLSLSRSESEQLPPEERGKPLKYCKATGGIKRPEGQLSPGAGDLAPQSVSAGLDVLLVGARPKDGVRSGEPLAGASRDGGQCSEPFVEQARKEFFGGVAPEWCQRVPTFESGEVAEALLEALDPERGGQTDHAVEQHGDSSPASNGAAEGLRLEVIDALLAEVELAGSGGEPRTRKRPNPVGFAGVGGARLVDTDKNLKASHDSTPNQLGGACR